MALPRRAIVEDLGRLAGLLLRGERPDIQESRRIVSALRRVFDARPVPADPALSGEEREQLGIALRFMDAAALVQECPLGCPVRAVVCVARQLQSQREMEGSGTRFARDPRRRRDRPDRPAELARHDKKRGTTPTRPTCVTARCALGAQVRVMLGDTPEAQAMAARAPRGSDTVEG
jgi:hypothetical protein